MRCDLDGLFEAIGALFEGIAALFELLFDGVAWLLGLSEKRKRYKEKRRRK